MCFGGSEISYCLPISQRIRRDKSFTRVAHGKTILTVVGMPGPTLLERDSICDIRSQRNYSVF